MDQGRPSWDRPGREWLRDGDFSIKRTVILQQVASDLLSNTNPSQNHLSIRFIRKTVSHIAMETRRRNGKMCARLLLLGFLATMPLNLLRAHASSELRIIRQANSTHCPPCGLIFSKLSRRESENSPREGWQHGRREQIIDVVERGEPKSGTGMMFHMAGGCLWHTCEYLNGLFGEKSCTVSLK